MLYTVDRQRIDYIPHRQDYDRWRARLSADQLQAITEELEKVLNQGEVHVSSFVPGSDWTGTVYQPIYEIGCDEDERQAAFFFGILMWVAVMNHPDAWSFLKYKESNIQGMTYFRITVD